MSTELHNQVKQAASDKGKSNTPTPPSDIAEQVKGAAK